MAFMSESLGSLCIVLHGHLPYVLHHGSYPHGEAWLYEAAAETYLPLLDMIGECALLKARPALTIGLTPILLEQLAHDRFKVGFVEYLTERACGRTRIGGILRKTMSSTWLIWRANGRSGIRAGSNISSGSAGTFQRNSPSGFAKGISRFSPATRRTRICRCC